MLFNQPKGLIPAALSNMGERFGYYIMNAVLVLFLCSKFGLSEEAGGLIYSIFYAGIYVLSLVGGFISDKTQNYKGTIISGLVVMSLGYALLSIPILATSGNHSWLLALTCIALFLIAFGNGLFKGNLQAIVGQIYDNYEADAAKQGEEALAIAKNKRDTGFQIFYGHRFSFRMDGGHLMADMHMDTEPFPEAFRCLQRKLFRVCDDPADIIGKPAVCVRNVTGPFKNMNLGRFVQSSYSGGGSSAAGHTPDDNHFHDLVCPPFLRWREALPFQAERLVQHGENACFRLGTHGAVCHFAVLHNYQGGNTHNLERTGQFGFFIYIDLAHLNVRALLGDLIQNGAYHPAGAAPGSPEIQKNGFTAADHFFLKIILCNMIN